MPSRTRALRFAAKYLIATSLALFLVGLLAAFGNRQLGLSPSSVSNFGAYPLPGTPLPGGSGPIASPTRLAAYPLPGARPTPARPGAPGAPLSFTPVSTSYLPLIPKGVGAKGTAGVIDVRTDPGFTNEITMGVQWGYNWNVVYSTTSDVYSSTFPYQIVNDVRSTITTSGFITWNIIFQGGVCPGGNTTSTAGQAALKACVANVAFAHPGQYWMVWNEPDNPDVSVADAFSSTVSAAYLGAQYFKEISDTILTADPKAKLIVGNVSSLYPDNEDAFCNNLGENYCRGVLWLSKFITDYQTLYGVTPYSAIAGYGIHAYMTSPGGTSRAQACPNIDYYTVTPCLMDNWNSYVLTGVNWIQDHDPNKELWVTEMNWEPASLSTDTWATEQTRMQDICAAIQITYSNSIQRYAWFYGRQPYLVNGSYASLEKLSLYTSTQPYMGVLSPGGIDFTTSCH